MRARNCQVGARPGSTTRAGSQRAWCRRPTGIVAAQMIEPIRVVETLRPIAVTEPKPGMFIFDLGQNMVGWCRLKVSGPAGTQVSLRHAETLKPDGTLDLANIRGARVTDIYTLKGRGHGSLGAAFHLPRLPLRRDEGLSRQAGPGRARRARRSRRSQNSRRVCLFESAAQSNLPEHRLGRARQLPQHPHRLPAAGRAPGLAGRPLRGVAGRDLPVRQRGPLRQVAPGHGRRPEGERQRARRLPGLLADLFGQCHLAQQHA